MKNYHLPQSELDALKEEHRHLHGKRFADQIKAVYLLGSGWKPKEVAEALLIDDDTVRHYFKKYKDKGITALVSNNTGGSKPWLDEEQLKTLEAHLNQTLYLTAKEVAHYVYHAFGVCYSERGMISVLHRLNYVYKKPELVPGKADSQAQEAFLEELETLKKLKSEQDPIYYMDATHPHHNPVAGYGWIKKGETYAIPTNTGRTRLNINGAFNIETMNSLVRYDKTINSQSTIELFKQIEAAHPEANEIYVICDNARYYRSTLIKDYLKDSTITLVFLPPYSPNLNLIERYWKFFKKRVLYGIYYETFSAFKKACDHFFANTKTFENQLRSLMTEKFQMIQS
ncbi:MAG: IS630 family transposase [bacterium]